MKAKIFVVCALLSSSLFAGNNPSRAQLPVGLLDLYVDPVLSGADGETMGVARARQVLGISDDSQRQEAYKELALLSHPDKGGTPTKIVQWLFKLNLPIKIEQKLPGGGVQAGKLADLPAEKLHNLNAQGQQDLREMILRLNKNRGEEIFKIIGEANTAIKHAVNPKIIHELRPRVASASMPANTYKPFEAKVDDQHNKEWRDAGYVGRLRSHLRRRTLNDRTGDAARTHDWLHKLQLMVEKTKKENTEKVSKQEGESAADFAKRQQEAAEKNDKLDKRLQEVKESGAARNFVYHNRFAPQRWWQGATALGVNPSLLTDAVDVLTFTSDKKKNLIAGSAAAGIGRLLDTGLNRPFAHSTLNAEQAKTYVPVSQRKAFGDGHGSLMRFETDGGPKVVNNGEEDKEFDPEVYVDEQTRQAAAQKEAGMFPAQGLASVNQYIAQPLSLLTDTGYTILNQDELALYNKHLKQNAHKNEVMRYVKSLRNKRIGVAGLIGLESALNAAKYALYLKQQQDPAHFYTTKDDQKWVDYSNKIAALSAAISLIRRGWWNWTKAQHIDRAVQHHELEQYRQQLATGQTPEQPLL